jgi:hypothetical protein
MSSDEIGQQLQLMCCANPVVAVWISDERSGESRGRPRRSYLIIRLKYRTEYRQLIYKSKVRDGAENKKTE